MSAYYITYYSISLTKSIKFDFLDISGITSTLTVYCYQQINFRELVKCEIWAMFEKDAHILRHNNSKHFSKYSLYLLQVIFCEFL